MRKRLLLLAHFFPPLAGGGVHRALSFARYLPAHGWDCTVVCAGEDDYWVRDPSLLAQVPPETEVLRVRGGSALSAWLRMRGGSGRRRAGTFAGLRALSDWWLLPDSYTGWSRKAREVASRRIAAGGIHALLSTSPPESIHLAAADVARRTGTPWVADFRDPWIPLHFRTPPTAWHRDRQAAMERRVIEQADLVLTASRTHLDELGAATGVRARRAEHLPNGFEPAVAGAGIEPDRDHFRIAYTGSLSLMEEAATLLEAIHDLLARLPEARRRIRLDLAGPYDLEYEDRATALGLTGIVRFSGPVSHAESRALQRRADALVLWKPRGAGFRTMVPGKLYEYLDSGRPVLALLAPQDEAAALLVRGGGQVLPQGDRAALARALETMYTTWKQGGRAPSARPGWLAEYERVRLAARLAKLLDELTGETT